MSRPATILRPAGLLIALLILGACEKGLALPTYHRPVDEAKVDPALLDACRKRADEIYERQNRAAIYTPSMTVNNPLSSGYDPALGSKLPAIYAHQQRIQDCLRNANAANSRVDVVQPPPAAATSSTPKVTATPIR